jgi:hypothetical protein
VTESAAEPVKLYNANDGLTGRDGGPYLDIEEARAAEKRRAFVEDREPDYDNMPLGAGVKLVNAQQLVSVEGVANIPSQSDNPAATEALSAAVSTLENVQPVAEQPAEAISNPEPTDLSATSFLAGEYNAEDDDEGPKETNSADSSPEDEF